MMALDPTPLVSFGTGELTDLKQRLTICSKISAEWIENVSHV